LTRGIVDLFGCLLWHERAVGDAGCGDDRSDTARAFVQGKSIKEIAAREEHGWIMDCVLLKKPGGETT
jgi:hypothetical protein